MATWRLPRAFFPLLVPAATRWLWDNAMSFLQEITFPSHSANPLWSSWECNFSASPLLSSLPLSYLQRARGPELVNFQGESIIPCWEVRGSRRWYKWADSKFQLTNGCLQCDCDHPVIPLIYLWSQSHSFSLLVRFMFSDQTREVLTSHKSPGDKNKMIFVHKPGIQPSFDLLSQLFPWSSTPLQLQLDIPF